jgi:glucose-6-phosphate 1-dehydrogenase
MNLMDIQAFSRENKCLYKHVVLQIEIINNDEKSYIILFIIRDFIEEMDMSNQNQIAECPEGIAFVIFGVTGDLTRRKLIPALYELLKSKHLPLPFHIIGFARRDWTDDFLRTTLRQALQEFSRSLPLDDQIVDLLLKNVHYVRSTFEDPAGYANLAELIHTLQIPNLLFYLATPPEEYLQIIHQIGASTIPCDCGGWTRTIVEKPYGNDINSAKELEREIHNVFTENQIYRIDHYLGKETVQNILVLRFANAIFEPLWNRRYVDHVQIMVSEIVGVGSRAGYYETSGVIRDMFQNHMLQLLSLTAMEAPVNFHADSVRDEKVKVLKALRPIKEHETMNHTYRAQYVSGSVNGKRTIGYKDENGVSATSMTETYLATRFYIDNWRWAGVPFYLRSGKGLPIRATEITIQFKQAPLSLFNWQNMAGDAPNRLVLKLQPDEGISLSFGAKSPGPINQIAPVSMRFDYQETFGSEPPEAYERLLLDCLTGDATLFTRGDEVMAQWGFISSVLDSWKTQPIKNLPVYEAGTWGPPGSDEFIMRDGRNWNNPT